MFTSDERIRETSTTTGTGTYTLAGAPTGYQPFSSIAANNYTPYFATDGTNWEAGIGQYLSGPDRLTRDAVIASSNADAAVSWAAGTRTLRAGWPAWLAFPRYLSKSVAGSSNVALTQNEQRRRILEFTGALTGNIDVTVDVTPWVWSVYNNTSGDFTLTFKVSGQTGVKILRGRRYTVHCDGTDVRIGHDVPYMGAIAAGRNIAARTNSATPNSKLDLSADEIQVKDTSGNAKVLTTVAVTGDMAVTGAANGLDVAGEASSTWYYGWVIAKEDGTAAALISASSTTPTMPAGYTYRALVAAVRNDGSSNFIKFRQFGNEAYFEVHQSVLSAGSATTETAVSVASFVPPNATAFWLDTQMTALTDGSGNYNDTMLVRAISAADYWRAQFVHTAESPNSTIYNATGTIRLPNVSQQFYYLHTTAAGSSFGFDAYVGGFKLPCGGE